MSHARRRWEEAVLTAPTTVAYVRQSHRSAHWFIAQTLAGLRDASGLRKEDIDGLCLASFGLAPDTAIGLTQYVGLTVTWLDHIPLGGASGTVALRRALRAVEAGDAELRSSGIRVLNVFPGPIDAPTFRDVSHPKLPARALARAIVAALESGQEDCYPGDVAQDFLRRWRQDPKVLELELQSWM